jgi:hypothetical protein
MEPAEGQNTMEIEPTDDDDNETLNSLPVKDNLMTTQWPKI